MPFVKVGDKASYKLVDIVPMDGEEQASDGSVDLSWYSTTKGGFRFVTWYDEVYDMDDELITDEGGWCEDVDNQRYPTDLDEIVFGPGQWFFLAPNSGCKDPKLTVAGELITTDGSKLTTSVTLTPGLKTCVGNPLPVPTKLTEVIPMDGDGQASDGSVDLSWYSTTKGGFRFVTWYDEVYDMDDELITDKGGWCEDVDNQRYPTDIDTLSWDVGAGFFMAPNSGCKSPWVAFPNPFSAK